MAKPFCYVLALLIGTLWSGFCLSCLWRWFLVPLGVPPVGVAHAIGLAALASLLVRGGSSSFDADDALERTVALFLVSVVLPAFFLCVGWACSNFI